MQIEIDKFYKKFVEMEKESGLFEYQIDGIAIWDVVRYYCYFSLYDSVNGIKSGFVNRSSTTFYHKLKVSLFGVWSYFKTELSLKKKKYVFFSASRNKVNDRNIDFANDDIKKIIPKDSFLDVESYIDKYGYLNNNYHLKISKLFLKSNVCKNDIQKFINTLRISIEKHWDLINTTFLNHIPVLIVDFNKEKQYYSKFLEKVSPKTVFLTQNGVQKGLIYACKLASIKITELQHGIINNVHPNYSYCKGINYKYVKTIPDYLTVFSEFWEKQFFIPNAKVLVTGNSYFVPCYKVDVSKDIFNKDYLLVISSAVHQKSIEQFLDKYLELDKNVVIKLHPNQKLDICRIKKKYSELHVVFDEFSATDLIKNSKAVLMIQSTIAYEVLQLNKRLFILKSDNYKGLSNLFCLHNVFLYEKNEYIEKHVGLPETTISFFDNFDNKLLFDENLLY